MNCEQCWTSIAVQTLLLWGRSLRLYLCILVGFKLSSHKGLFRLYISSYIQNNLKVGEFYSYINKHNYKYYLFINFSCFCFFFVLFYFKFTLFNTTSIMSIRLPLNSFSASFGQYLSQHFIRLMQQLWPNLVNNSPNMCSN